MTEQDIRQLPSRTGHALAPAPLPTRALWIWVSTGSTAQLFRLPMTACRKTRRALREIAQRIEDSADTASWFMRDAHGHARRMSRKDVLRLVSVRTATLEFQTLRPFLPKPE